MHIESEIKLSFDDVSISPKMCPVDSRAKIDLTTNLCQGLVLKSPILSSNMSSITEWNMACSMHEMGGLGVLHRLMDLDKFAENITNLLTQKHQIIAFSVGIRDKEKAIPYLSMAYELRKIVKNKPYFIVFIDVAHGHNPKVIHMANMIKNQFPDFKVIAGNVCATEGAKYLESCRAIDGLRVGIGNGSACTTRIVTGAGVPQLSAIMDISDCVNLPIIADGGIRNSGDAVKALAAGADSVMIGRLLAGTDEAADKDVYRGMYSEDTIKEMNIEGYVPTSEGVSVKVNRIGSAKIMIEQLLKGIRSGMSYAGARNIRQLQNETVFVRQTANGVREGESR